MNQKWKRITPLLLTAAITMTGTGVEQLADPSVMGQAFVYAAEVQNNRLSEEDFESGKLGVWSGKDGATASVSTDNPRNGNYCMKVSGRTGTYTGAQMQLTGLPKGDYLLSVSAYVKYTDGPDKKRFQLTLAKDGQYSGVCGKEIKKNEWTKISGSMTVSADKDYNGAALYFETPWTPNPTAEQDFMDFYVDDIMVSADAFADTTEYPSLKELYKDQFYIGVAAPEYVLKIPRYSELIKSQYSSMTMENEMKPAYVLDENTSKSNPSKYQDHAALNFNSYKAGLEFASANGIKMRGHTLVWHSQTPDWFFFENYDTSGRLASRELMLKRMENYIKDIIEWTETNYPGTIYAWDVANEAVADYFGPGTAPMRQDGSRWYQTIGEDFVQKAFEYARKYTTQYAPDHKIKLFYNDYNEYFPQKKAGIVKLLKPIKEAGNIDGVGMQSHIDVDWPLEGDSGYMTAVRTFKEELGLEIQVTELDIGMTEKSTFASQGEYYQKFMEALLKEKADGADITAVTFWGLSDILSWRDSECLLLYGNLGQKPAFEGVVNAIGNTQEVIDRISALTGPELTKEDKEKLTGAREAYEGLSAAQKALVSNYNELEDAEKQYEELEEKARIAEEERKEQEAKKAEEERKAAQEREKAAKQAEFAKKQAESTKAAVTAPELIITGKKSVKVGKSIKLKAVCKGVSGKVKWSVSKGKKTVKINKKGKVTGLKKGRAVITAKVGHLKKKYVIVVK